MGTHFLAIGGVLEVSELFPFVIAQLVEQPTLIQIVGSSNPNEVVIYVSLFLFFYIL